MKKHHFFFTVFFLSILFFQSCQTEDTPVVYEKGTNQYANSWILEQMKKYYLWNENLPEDTDLSLNAKDYFKTLLQKEDRFSYAVNVALPETFPKSIRSSYGFDISFVEFENQTYGVVLYVLSDSPAERSGLKRGQLIKAINGVLLSSQNFENLYANLNNSDKIRLQLAQYSSVSGFSAFKETEVSRGFTFSKSIKHNIISYNNQKVGYIEIPHFDIGLAASFLSVFKEFQNQSVAKVIVDLRYNGGGDVSSAAALSIILAPNIKPNDIFIKFKGNKNGGLVTKTFKEALEMNETQTNFDALRTVHPPIQELYVLSGNHTASASEIIINNLKPYMKVIVIGDKTVGKDVAGFAIEDDRISGEQGWVLYPVIYKLFNVHDEGNYAAGIKPTVESNELQEMEIFPLGDAREMLLSQALNGNISSKQKDIPTIKKLVLNKNYIDTDPFLLIDL